MFDTALPQVRVVEAVAAIKVLAADAPRRDEGGFPTISAGEAAAPTLEALARARHSLESATATHMVAAEQSGATPFDPVTMLQSCGWSAAEAKRLLIAGRFVDRVGRFFPDLRRMWESGRLSTAQVRALAADTDKRCMAQTCDMVAALLPEVESMSAAQVARAAEAALVAARPEDADSREQDAYQRRRLTITDTDDGIRISGVLPRLEGEALAAVVNAMAERQRTVGDHLTAAQRRADGLTAVVAAAADTRAPSQGGLPASVVMTLPAAEAERIASRQAREPQPLFGAGCAGTQAPGSLGQRHLLGDGEARFGLCCADITPIAADEPRSLVARLAGGGVEPLAVGRAQRLATPAQRKALRLRDGGCAIGGCTMPAQQCQPHHVREWSLGGATDLGNMVLLCWAHHRQVDLNRWTITRRDRRWRATPTPRHQWRTRPPADSHAAA